MSGGSTELDVKGLVGRGEEYAADSKCKEKPPERSREKWACSDLHICKNKQTKTLHLGSYMKGRLKNKSERDQ